jgi:hypothetical protein
MQNEALNPIDTDPPGTENAMFQTAFSAHLIQLPRHPLQGQTGHNFQDALKTGGQIKLLHHSFKSMQPSRYLMEYFPSN